MMDETMNAGVNPEENAGAQDQTDEALQSQATAWVERVKHAKTVDKIKEGLKRIREDMKFAVGLQWPDQKDFEDARYVANITLRHLLQRRAALYARNPTAVAKRRETLDFRVWDGDPQKVMEAQQTLMLAQQTPGAMLPTIDGVTPNPLIVQIQQAQQLLQDYQQGMQRRQMIDRMGKSLEIVWNHQVGEQPVPFKTNMKSLVLRALTCGVGFLKLGFHRAHEYKPEDKQRVTDINEQIAALEARLDQSETGEVQEGSEELAELRQLLEKVTTNREVFSREGLDLDFPKPGSIIVDPACRQLKGFVGARWVAEEFLLTGNDISEIYGVDVASITTAVRYNGSGQRVTAEPMEVPADGTEQENQTDRYLVYEIYDKHTGQTMTVCDGVSDFLVAPQTPPMQLERFWPYFTLTFNDVESEEVLYPPSDVRLMRPMQQELNLTKQRLREHRDAARPGHTASKGRLDEEDKGKLESRSAHDVVELNGLGEQDDIRRILQPIPTNPIDPNLYEVGTVMQDVYQTVGTQEAVLGGATGATATETSIAESSRLSTIGEAVDELDDFLTEVTKAGSHLLLSEFTPDFVKEIAGLGAVWPDTTAPEVAKDLWLEVRAGSSGRPNKAMEIQNLERLMPYIIQIPNVKPKRVLQELIERLDDRLPLEEFYEAGMPSIVSQNSMTQPGTGDPGTDPTQQGVAGGDKNAVEQGDSNMGPRPPAENRNMDPNRPN